MRGAWPASYHEENNRTAGKEMRHGHSRDFRGTQRRVVPKKRRLFAGHLDSGEITPASISNPSKTRPANAPAVQILLSPPPEKKMGTPSIYHADGVIEKFPSLSSQTAHFADVFS